MSSCPGRVPSMDSEQARKAGPARPHGRSIRFILFCWLGLLCVPAGRVHAAQEAPSVQLPPAEAEASVGFTRVASVRELTDGRLLLVDQGENRLRVLDWSSGSVEDIGREGQGPGEYSSAGWLYALSDSTTLLTDANSRRWLLLEGVGIRRTLSAANPVVSSVHHAEYLFFGSVDGRRFLTADGYRWDPSATRRRRQSADSLMALVIEADDGLERVLAVDTVAILQGAGLAGDGCALGMGGGGVRTCSLIRSEDRALMFEDGWMAIARVSPYRVDWRTPEGDWVLGAPLEAGAGPPVDRETRCWVMGWGPDQVQECDEDRRFDSWTWPDVMPPFLPRVTRGLPGESVPVLLPTPGGTLLIRRAPSFPEPRARYDLVDRTGALRATVELPPRQAIVGFGDDVVYTVRMDEFDLQWLRRHPWPFE